jgi:hypothetical protein
MENIKMYEEFDQIEWDDELKVPRSTFEEWCNYLTDDAGEVVIVQVLDVQEQMKKFLDDYYDNKIDAADPDEIARKHAEDIEPEEDMTGAAADEDPTLIKKFEE